jgi:hypothetical protein
MTERIELTRGKFALVDRANFAALSRHKWFALLNGRTTAGPRYVAARTTTEEGVRRTILMHRQIAGAVKGQEVDHRNRDSLDNREANLRLATRSQNCINTRVENRTGFRGVQARANCFVATGYVNGVRHNLGCFKTAAAAARAYDDFASAHHGEFAVLNFPELEAQ